jgi:EamA domain-containing membrane protein RarD
MDFTNSFLGKMMSENGQPSSKRWIAVTVAAALTWGICYAITHATTASDRKNVLDATMLFVLIMAGVATIAQITSLIKGTPQPKDDDTKKESL